jgi:protein phosphatase
MRIEIPEFALVALIGTSGSGKSTFGRTHFLPNEVLSSDAFRGWVDDDENSQDATIDAFEALHFVLGKRLKRGRFSVVDATNVQPEARRPLLKLADQWHALKVAIVFDIPESICHARNELRSDRQFGPHVIRNQRNELRRSLGLLRREKWHKVYVLKPEDVENAEIVRSRIWSRKPEEHGPFDIVGDLHGCREELEELLTSLGWQSGPDWVHPEGRKLVFLGDFVDRGPDPVGVLRIVMSAVKREVALCVPGNHDIKLLRALHGKDVSRNHGLAETMAALEQESEEFRAQVREFLDSLVSHAVLDDGKLCVAHAGLREEMQGRGSAAIREFALYGETTGEIDEFGLPVRYNWAGEYRGRTTVVYGHTPIPEPEWLNNTINIDTGCCFGGRLTALRYPERELVSVAARQVYSEPIRPVQPVQEVATGEHTHLLVLEDVVGRRSVEVANGKRVTIREENAIAALEVMSRFATDPRWLIYLPPTMSPCRTSTRDGYLEHAEEALDYYRHVGVAQVVCEEKHMGSRAVAIVCRSNDVAKKRFGVETGESGIITTRTGRRFFDDIDLEQTVIRRIESAADRAGIFQELESDWLLLDLELMPWSAKAQGLLRSQYAPVGTAALHATTFLEETSQKLAERGVDGLPFDVAARRDAAVKFTDAYRRYCWTVSGIDDYKLAPFHLLASEGKVHVDKTHVWHMETLGRIVREDDLLKATPWRLASLEDEAQVHAACEWWESLVASGGEGMVVKPVNFIATSDGRPIQPAVKCRGPEYLRIIYGPEYLRTENLSRLRKRGLGRKQALAANEFALGVEAMQRFVRYEPLRRVHECVFGVLALESEPVDPRL